MVGEKSAQPVLSRVRPSPPSRAEPSSEVSRVQSERRLRKTQDERRHPFKAPGPQGSSQSPHLTNPISGSLHPTSGSLVRLKIVSNSPLARRGVVLAMLECREPVHWLRGREPPTSGSTDKTWRRQRRGPAET